MDWEPVGPSSVPVEPAMWGKDHLSMITYIVARTLDYAGVLDNKHLRIHAAVHGVFQYDPQYDGAEYPTKLADDKTTADYGVLFHDDFSCIQDLVALGYVEAWAQEYDSMQYATMRIKALLTDKGLDLAKAIIKHRGQGKPLSKFKVKTPV